MEKSQVKINKKVAVKTKEVELIGDIIVPDVKPDIINIINTDGISFITKEEILNSKLRVDGMLDLNIVYLSASADVRCLKSMVQFVESFDDLDLSEDDFIKSNVCIEEINTKILNERKVEVIAKLSIKIDVFEEELLEFVDNVSDIKDLEKLDELITVKKFKNRALVKTSLKENIVLTENTNIAVDDTDKIVEILNYDIKVGNMENKQSYNKILSKADCLIKLLYTTEKNQIKTYEASLPVTCFIDCKDIKETDEIMTTYVIRNISFRLGDKSDVDVCIDFEVKADVFEKEELTIIKDIYSLDKKIDCTKKEVLVEVLDTKGEKNVENYSCHERVIVDEILNLYMANISPKIMNYERKSSGMYLYKIDFCMTVLYEAANNNNLNVKKIVIPCQIELPSQITEHDIIITNKNINLLSNDNVDITIDYKIDSVCKNLKNIEVIDSIAENDEIDTDNNDYKMVMYFIKPGDTIWKIAKEFKVKMNDIIEINELANPDKINVGDRLYIVR